MTRRMTRRRTLALGAGTAIAVAVGGCAAALSRPVVALPTAPPSAPPLSVRAGGRITLHMLQTGWVAVKQEHRAFAGPPAARLPAIVASGTWTEWLPVTAFVVEHPSGLVVVDTGETARILEPGYTACDPVTGLFYRRNLQFALNPEDEIGPQMRRAGLDPERVTTVIMTHLHSDHMGGMRYFPRARFLISEAALGGHTGALTCRIPGGLNITAARYDGGPAGIFPQSLPVTQDGAITVIPTPGHATGHQSVLVRDAGRSLCLAGDAAFTFDQILSGEVGGIVESVADARASSAALKRQHQAFGTVMLPTHDPGNAARLRAL